MKPNLYLGGAIAVIILLVLLNIRTCKKDSDKTALLEAMGDSLQTYRNDSGQQVAIIRTLVGTVEDLQALKTSKDSSIKWLSSVVSKQKGTIAALVLSNSTKDSAASKTTVSFPDKPKFKPGIRTSYVYPTYKTEWSDQWSRGSIRAAKDSIFRDFTIYNDFELNTHQEGGFLKKSVMVSTITNNNPHTQTVNMRTFQTEVKTNRGFWFVFGNVTGAAAMYFLRR